MPGGLGCGLIGGLGLDMGWSLVYWSCFLEHSRSIMQFRVALVRVVLGVVQGGDGGHAVVGGRHDSRGVSRVNYLLLLSWHHVALSCRRHRHIEDIEQLFHSHIGGPSMYR